MTELGSSWKLVTAECRDYRSQLILDTSTSLSRNGLQTHSSARRSIDCEPGKRSHCLARQWAQCLRRVLETAPEANRPSHTEVAKPRSLSGSRAGSSH